MSETPTTPQQPRIVAAPGDEDRVYDDLAQIWAATLPSDANQMDDADMVVSSCLADLRAVIETGELPAWYTSTHEVSPR